MSPISARVLAALVAAGATTEQLVAAVKAEEAAEAERQAAAEERKEQRREKERLKKRKYRAKQCPPMSPGTNGDIGGPPSFPPITPLSPPGGGDGGGDARVREAAALAQDVFVLVGIDLEFVPPLWCGLAMFLQAGLAGGWKPDVVRLAVRKVMAQRRQDGAPTSFRYFEKPITREHELAARPVPPVPSSDGDFHAPTQRELTLVRSVPARGSAGFTAIAAEKARRRTGGA